jgi:hypothetical protein
MEEHQRWQQDATNQFICEAIDEVQSLPPRAPKAGRLFQLLPEHISSKIPGLQ